MKTVKRLIILIGGAGGTLPSATPAIEILTRDGSIILTRDGSTVIARP